MSKELLFNCIAGACLIRTCQQSLSWEKLSERKWDVNDEQGELLKA